MVVFADFFTPNEEEAFGLKENWRQADADSPKFMATVEWLQEENTLPFLVAPDNDGDGWVRSSWFGWVFRGWLGEGPDTAARWVFQEHHGLLYIAPSFTDEAGFWMWHDELADFVYTGSNFYNTEQAWVYVAGREKWFYFYQDFADRGMGNFLIAADGEVLRF